MMLKDAFATAGAFETLREVRAIGYRSVELSQIPLTASTTAGLQRARDELGVEVAAISAGLAPGDSPGPALESDLAAVVADARALGTRTVRIGMLPASAAASPAALLDFSDRCQVAASRLRDDGLRLLLHNHHVEFARHDGRLLLDVVAERAPLLGLELDVHWVQRGGLDPVTTLRRYGDRVALVHLKDYRVGPPADLSGGWSVQEFTSNVQFAEVGEGNLDFPAIVATSLALGVEHLLVEQDERYGSSALECLRTSHANLVAMGFGDLF
ncbi:sugar phosphate isomerase [Rathayibacter sp. AY1F4]|nr:sugar phosphate isomerase [Rathayibacter sp. AY2B1]PPG73832.1 sugar phosphate isomerase [Rathayibacter sp. AY1F4]